MTALQIDLAATSAAQRDLVGAGEALADVERSVASAASRAALDGEQAGILALLDVALGEIDAASQIFGLTAEGAVNADASYQSMLDGWIGSLAAAMRGRINDSEGTPVADLLANDGLDAAALLALDADSAQEWFDALPESARIELLAVHQDMLGGTFVEHLAQTWQDGLDADQLRELFTVRALANAGIDPTQWDPSLGTAHNATTIEAVYEYYAELYRNNTDRLWWSGMAAMIGPSFYGGFRDLDTFAGMIDAIATIQGGPLGAVLPSGIGANEVASWSSRELADELDWYQTRLLSMQREIFYDMAPAHEAYLDGGVAMIERLYADSPYGYGDTTIAAWAAVDEGWRTGDLDLIAAGNEILLRREQQYVIADDYDQMRARPVTGGLVTWAMTAIGAPSVPGAQTYPEVFPASFDVSRYVGTPRHLPEPPVIGWLLPDVPLPHIGAEGTVAVDTPLPDGNISHFGDRWALIEADTLPVYVDLARNHPDVVLDELATPVGERSDDFTFQHRIDDLIRDAVTNWDVDLDLSFEADW